MREPERVRASIRAGAQSHLIGPAPPWHASSSQSSWTRPRWSHSEPGTNCCTSRSWSTTARACNARPPALQRCQAVGRLGVGLDNIDVAGCQARGIRVLVASGANAPSVAEYVIAAALLLLRGAYGATAALASGHWPRAALSNGREFAGKTLGLVGFGAIGQLTARSAAALGVRTMACDAL